MTVLKRLDGMTWEELVDFMKVNRHALILETTSHEVEVAKLANDDEEAGAALAIAYRFMEKYGAPRTAWRAYLIYEELSPKSRNLRSLRDSLSWVRGEHNVKNLPWPCGPVPDDPERRGGLANLLFFAALSDMAGGSTTEIIAAEAIRKFLTDGMERKTERKCNAKAR